MKKGGKNHGKGLSRLTYKPLGGGKYRCNQMVGEIYNKIAITKNPKRHRRMYESTVVR